MFERFLFRGVRFLFARGKCHLRHPTGSVSTMPGVWGWILFLLPTKTCSNMNLTTWNSKRELERKNKKQKRKRAAGERDENRKDETELESRKIETWSDTVLWTKKGNRKQEQREKEGVGRGKSFTITEKVYHPRKQKLRVRRKTFCRNKRKRKRKKKRERKERGRETFVRSLFETSTLTLFEIREMGEPQLTISFRSHTINEREF